MVFCDLILACILYAQVPFAAFKGGTESLHEIPWLFSLGLRLFFVNLGMSLFLSLRLC